MPDNSWTYKFRLPDPCPYCGAWATRIGAHCQEGDPPDD